MKYKYSKYWSFLVAVILIKTLAFEDVTAQEPDSVSSADINYAIGADLSFLKSAEDRGVEFKDNGQVKPGLEIFSDHGYNWIRLRLWHTPTRSMNDLEYTIELAQEAKKYGFKFLLDYHYADSWADPGKQPIPAAWDTTNVEVLIDSVYQYTKNTIEAFREAGVMPEMVQIGNEVRNGMLWPLGKLPQNWDNFAALFKAGVDGVDAGRGQAPRPLIMLHYDNGADTDGAKQYYEKFNSYNIPYDIIGLSYYPWWHGNLLQFRENLLSLVDNFDKDIVLVETGYRPHEYEDHPAPYPEEIPGGPRKAFLEDVNETLLNVSSRKIKGVFWWEPASGCGRDYFDEECNARPVINVFDKYKRGKTGEDDAPE
ncbi:glycoside hydrolase family 53 protein [Fodinibius salsisoli]|uniref:Arabinogalactan endo-beta-1,4-galactanase n=1 Tax=Fodinibius salsisoli TaxID=2820877 RepID=A0ABT3PJW9_9BACT|nr:glycosyl hydrolase 53 family protein [Fodinibius salsisoli]MCW9706063.1 glycosyl hydrolase 53 family protein [Fodinibius salsisoli]